MIEKFKVHKDFHNSRFDRWFKKKIINIPQSLLEKIIRKKKVKVNKKIIKRSYRVQENDTVEVFGLSKIQKNIQIKKKKYIPSSKEKNEYKNFVLEDNKNFIVINKPAGIPVQGGTKSFKNIVDILKNTVFFENTKPFIVHRIDKETSGVLLIAKNREYAQLFTSLFRIRKMHKTYLAIVHGRLNEKIKILKDNLITYDKNKKVIQKAISYFKVLKSTEKFSLLELNPVTGRKHQLRKQLYNIGNPVVGDNKYYFKNQIKKNKNLFLHAYQLKFMINQNKYSYKARYNKEFENFIKKNI